MSWDEARAALDAQFLTLPGLDPARVAWPGLPFTPPAAGTWYQVSFLPAGVDPEISGADHERGIYQVSVFTKPGSGTGALLQAADAVSALYSRKRLGNVSCGVPSLGPLIPEPDWLQNPVSIPFQHL